MKGCLKALGKLLTILIGFVVIGFIIVAVVDYLRTPVETVTARIDLHRWRTTVTIYEEEYDEEQEAWVEFIVDEYIEEGTGIPAYYAPYYLEANQWEEFDEEYSLEVTICDGEEKLTLSKVSEEDWYHVKDGEFWEMKIKRTRWVGIRLVRLLRQVRGC
jgi:hypothetical protein